MFAQFQQYQYSDHYEPYAHDHLSPLSPSPPHVIVPNQAPLMYTYTRPSMVGQSGFLATAAHNVSHYVPQEQMDEIWYTTEPQQAISNDMTSFTGEQMTSPQRFANQSNTLTDTQAGFDGVTDIDLESYFPNISTDLSREVRKSEPLNLLHVVYPTPADEHPFYKHEKSFSAREDFSMQQFGNLGSPLSLNLSEESLSLSKETLGNRSSISYPPDRIHRVCKPSPNKASRSPTSLNFSKQDSTQGVHTTQPGPIPASEPKVTIDPETGDEVLSFSYSKQKIIKNFIVRCPVQPMSSYEMPDEFLRNNCVYPRAMVPPEEYKGNRGKYERDCNEVGWRLSWYNPDIRGHRGLIQRAVDSWRNTRSDKSLRSRRVRKNNHTCKET